MNIHLLDPAQVGDHDWDDDEEERDATAREVSPPVAWRRLWDGAARDMTREREEDRPNGDHREAPEEEWASIRREFARWMDERLNTLGYPKTGAFADLGEFTYQYLHRIRTGKQAPGRPVAHWISQAIAERLSDDPVVQDQFYREGMHKAGFVVPPREILPVPAPSAVDEVAEAVLQMGQQLLDAAHKLRPNRVKSERAEGLKAAMMRLGAERRSEGMIYGGTLAGTLERSTASEEPAGPTLAETFGGDTWYYVEGDRFAPLAQSGDALLLRLAELGEEPVGRRVVLRRGGEVYCRRLCSVTEDGSTYLMETLAGEALPPRSAAEIDLLGVVVAVTRPA